MSNIKLDVEVERKKYMNKRPPRVDTAQIASKKIEFQMELTKPIRDTTSTRRHRHHERNHHRDVPTQGVK